MAEVEEPETRSLAGGPFLMFWSGPCEWRFVVIPFLWLVCFLKRLFINAYKFQILTALAPTFLQTFFFNFTSLQES